MTRSQDCAPPPLPASLETKLSDYRRKLWCTKTAEAALAALFGLVLSFLLVFGLDRLMETPGWLRLVVLAAGLVGGALFLPLQVSRWVGGHASLAAVARRIARRELTTGDRILSVMELCTNREEFARSPELALAAIRQDEEALRATDLERTLPRSRHRAWGLAAGLGLAAALSGFALVPEAANNAFARWLRPLASIERYTFAQLEPFETHTVVARHEPFEVVLKLSADTRSRPATATLELEGGESVSASLADGGYRLELPGLAARTAGRLLLGDYRAELRLEPVDRPEVSEAHASVALPAYLELSEPIIKDVRGGTLGVVSGSSVALTVELTRELSSARWSAGAARVEGARLSTEALPVSESVDTQLSWRDVHGLAGTVPFQLGLRAAPDGRPTATIVGLEPEMILLHDQAMLFSVRTGDDFGVRQVGLEWEGIGGLEGRGEVAHGEKSLGLGEPDAARLELAATLHPRLLGIAPQILRLRAYALDALPGRERCYSAPITVQVMTEDEHMIWVTRALAGWYDEAVEVRDEEHHLLGVNEELLALSNDELRTPEVQRRIQGQATAERVNSRRLGRLVASGSELLAEASRNNQFNSNTMDDWAEMMSALEDIAEERMPSVAGLLAEAARKFPDSQAGVKRDGRAGPPSSSGKRVELPSDPTVADIESSFNDPAEPAPASKGGKATPANLTLPETVVQGGGAKTPPPPPAAADEDDEAPGPTKQELARAVAEQRALMEEFQKVAGQIAEILADLEGSTFVKRLKALSRAETGVARELDTTLNDSFGAAEVPETARAVVANVSEVQERSAQRASLVREDLTAYVERMQSAGRDTHKFEDVHEEMGEVGVTREMAAIEGLADASRTGEALAGAENLADNLDRWAEILVGPG